MASSRSALARCSIRDDAVVTHWLTARDYPWLAGLVEQYVTFVGEPRRRLDEHIARLTADTIQTRPGWTLALHALDGIFRTEIAASISPPLARSAVFQAAASRRTRKQILERVAQDLDASVAALESSLFADLPCERLLRAPVEPVHASSLALGCNLAIAQAMLKNSSKVTISIDGNARAVVRHAKLRGLICTVSHPKDRPTVVLEISGPLALFRRTALYGRHLAELVPLLPWSENFELQATCSIRGQEGRLTLTPRDPIPPATEPRRYDSRLEKRFARDFTRTTTEWRLLREPEPVATEGTLIFPDFAIIHVRNPRRRWLLEIVGFWTKDYVEKKLRRLRKAGIRNLVLCIDASLDCGEGGLPKNCSVLRFRKRIEARDVLSIIQADERSSASATGPDD